MNVKDLYTLTLEQEKSDTYLLLISYLWIASERCIRTNNETHNIEPRRDNSVGTNDRADKKLCRYLHLESLAFG